MVELHRRNLESAIEYCIKSLKILEELNDKKRIAMATNQLGTVEERRGNLDKAEEYHLKSLRLFEEIDDKEGIIASLHGLGTIEITRKNPNRAEEYFKRTMSIEKDISHLPGIAATLVGMGQVFEMKGKPISALKRYLESAYRFNEIGSPDERIALRNMIDMYEKIGEKKFLEVLSSMPKEIRRYIQKLLSKSSANLT